MTELNLGDPVQVMGPNGVNENAHYFWREDTMNALIGQRFLISRVMYENNVTEYELSDLDGEDLVLENGDFLSSYVWLREWLEPSELQDTIDEFTTILNH